MGPTTKTAFYLTLPSFDNRHLELARLPEDEAEINHLISCATALGLDHAVEPVKGQLYDFQINNSDDYHKFHQIDQARIRALVAKNEGMSEFSERVTDIVDAVLGGEEMLEAYEIL